MSRAYDLPHMTLLQEQHARAIDECDDHDTEPEDEDAFDAEDQDDGHPGYPPTRRRPRRWRAD